MRGQVDAPVARLLDDGGDGALALARELLAARSGEVDQGFPGERCEDLGVAHPLREVGPLAPAPP